MGWRFFKLGEGPSVRFHSPHDPAMMDMQFNLERVGGRFCGERCHRGVSGALLLFFFPQKSKFTIHQSTILPLHL
jgi:hypothetical protein